METRRKSLKQSAIRGWKDMDIISRSRKANASATVQERKNRKRTLESPSPAHCPKLVVDIGLSILLFVFFERLFLIIRSIGFVVLLPCLLHRFFVAARHRMTGRGFIWKRCSWMTVPMLKSRAVVVLLSLAVILSLTIRHWYPNALMTLLIVRRIGIVCRGLVPENKAWFSYCNGVDGLHTHCTSNQTSTHSANCKTTSGASKHPRVAVGLALLRFAVQRLAELRGRWRRLAVASTVSASTTSATMMIVFVTEG